MKISQPVNNKVEHFDLNDIEKEPTDEQLASLMEAVLEEVLRKSKTIHENLINNLKAGIATKVAKQSKKI